MVVDIYIYPTLYNAVFVRKNTYVPICVCCQM